MTAVDYAERSFKARVEQLDAHDRSLGRIYAALAAYAAQSGDEVPVFLAMIAADHPVPPLDLIDRVQNNYYDELATAVRPDVKQLRDVADEALNARAWDEDYTEAQDRLTALAAHVRPSVDSTGEGPAEPGDEIAEPSA